MVEDKYFKRLKFLHFNLLLLIGRLLRFVIFSMPFTLLLFVKLLVFVLVEVFIAPFFFLLKIFLFALFEILFTFAIVFKNLVSLKLSDNNSASSM